MAAVLNLECAGKSKFWNASRNDLDFHQRYKKPTFRSTTCQGPGRWNARGRRGVVRRVGNASHIAAAPISESHSLRRSRQRAMLPRPRIRHRVHFRIRSCSDDDPSRDAALDIEGVSIARGVYIYIYIPLRRCTHAARCTCACFASNFVELRELFLSKTLYAFRFRLLFLSSFSHPVLAHSPPPLHFHPRLYFVATLEDNSRRNAVGTNVRTRYLLHCPSRNW